MNIQEIDFQLLKEQNDLKLLARKMGLSVTNVISSKNNLKDLALNEIEIEKLQLKLRSSWQEKSFLKSKDIFKSPPEDEKIQTNSNRKIEYGYERTIQVPSFENQLHRNFPYYTGFSLIYSSAMAGYLCILNTLSKIFKNKRKIFSGFIGGYFESIYLTHDMSNSYFHISYLQNENKISQLDLTKIDALFVEPVRYNFNLEKTDVFYIFEYIKTNKPPKKVIFLILDTTLMGEAFPINDLLNLGKSIESLIVVNIKSCLKLHQEGFEFTNVGLVSFYFPKKLDHIREKLFTFMQAQRGITGTNLSLYEYCLIDNDFFINSINYTNQIHENTDHFFRNLNLKCNGSIISEIIYPNIDKKVCSLHKCPFIFIKLTTEKEEDYLNFLEYIRNFVEDYKLTIPLRNSFGFRNICLQFIKSVEDHQKLIIKVAPGKLRGVKHFLLLECINKLVNFNNFDLLNSKKG